MNLIMFFKEVVKTLQASNADYALAGGLVASVYRKDERTTNDLDFLIFSGKKTQEMASSIIRQFGLEPHVIRKADLEGGPMFAIKRGNTPPYIVAGRAKKDEKKIGLDFILPNMPWFEESIKRAKFNEIDFGFGPVACLTKEDLIIAKLYSLQNDQSRFNDLDDLKSILQAGHDIDIPYICGQMQKLELSVPDLIKDFVPKPILLTSKRVRREFKNR
ncbi:MAG: nucleotidyl transferase AbiEii/AbiGii toxin family protein [Deltaproteobacteria bacterium]|nr:nucleotidyl transferase AbiEii/AbiGii toxin family protein [Deltaproteobacteria bacterium]